MSEFNNIPGNDESSEQGNYPPRDGYEKKYEDQRGGDKAGEFIKDRDARRVKFKKFDKIATRKLDIDYKKPEILQEFLTEKGKILSRVITGCSAQNQHKLTLEVKRARYVGLLPTS